MKKSLSVLMIACFGLSALADVTVNVASRVTEARQGMVVSIRDLAESIDKNSLTEDEWMLDEKVAVFFAV